MKKNDLEVNIKFSYLYRDSSNFKEFGHIILSNPENISVEELSYLIKEKLIDGDFFIPEKWNIEPFKIHDFIDSYWYEFESLDSTLERTTVNSSVSEFINSIEI